MAGGRLLGRHILADDIALHEVAWRVEAQAREQGAEIALSLALSHGACRSSWPGAG